MFISPQSVWTRGENGISALLLLFKEGFENGNPLIWVTSVTWCIYIGYKGTLKRQGGYRSRQFIDSGRILSVGGGGGQRKQKKRNTKKASHNTSYFHLVYAIC